MIFKILSIREPTPSIKVIEKRESQSLITVAVVEGKLKGVILKKALLGERQLLKAEVISYRRERYEQKKLRGANPHTTQRPLPEVWNAST